MIEHTRFKDAELNGLADKMAANQKSEIEALRSVINRGTRQAGESGAWLATDRACRPIPVITRTPAAQQSIRG
jgi:hypothetical protein